MKTIKIKKVEYFIRYEAEAYYLVSKDIEGPKFKIDKK
jgi:hypothetical protein